MSFDILFQPCRFSGPLIARRNPFTGKMLKTTPNKPLTARELAAVRAVLKKVAGSSSKDEVYGYRLADGGEGEVFAENLATGCMVSIRELTPEVHHFLFELLKAGNWVMRPAMDDPVAITTSPESMKGVPHDFPRVVVCRSPEEIGTLLANGFRVWLKSKDQVTGKKKRKK